MENKLEKTLTLFPAVGLAITMVVGSGLLILPGLVYQQVGNVAVYAWIISAIISIPLLMVFSTLGAEFPGAGGIAGFMQAIFSRRAGAATEILILGTLPGGAALAVTGGKYMAAFMGGGTVTLIFGTFLILFIGGMVNYFGAKLSGRVQQVIAVILVVMLSSTAIVALLYGDTSQGEGIAPLPRIVDAFPGVGLVFFAFVGWELMSFTTEEFINPKRDFPLMVAISFIIVSALYFLIAAALQIILPSTHPSLSKAPIAGLLSLVLGDLSGKVISFAGILIALSNFISVVWAFSRLTFSSAREGLLPCLLAVTEIHNKIPRNAVTASISAIFLILLLHFSGIISQSLMFELAGISFFMSYILAVVAFIKKSKKTLSKLFGILTFLCVSVVFINFGMKILYPLSLFIIGYIGSGVYKQGPGSYTIGTKINLKDRETPIETDHCACNPEQGENKGIC